MNFTVLKELFAAFLRTHHLGRHFRRLALFESIAGTTVSRELPPTLSQTLIAASALDANALLASLHSRHEGLRGEEADTIRAEVGSNEVEHEKPLPWWAHLWHCYRNPFNLLLTLLAGVSCWTDDMKATVVISSMVLLSTLLRFWQEVKSNKAADALKAMVSNTATVLRPGAGISSHATSALQMAGRAELPIQQLVPGDLILLSAGDMIPADCRLLSAKDLFVSQAAMTGESLPVEKFALHARPHDAQTLNPLELELVLFINGFTKGDWTEALLFALSVAVGLTPEMLPMNVTSTLAKGACSCRARRSSSA